MDSWLPVATHSESKPRQENVQINDDTHTQQLHQIQYVSHPLLPQKGSEMM